MHWNILNLKMLNGLLLILIISATKINADLDGEQHDDDKRHVGAMARDGLLPFQGKRYLASLARNGELPSYAHRQWSKKFHPMSFGRNNEIFYSNDAYDTDKRYMGSLAKSGNLPFATVGKRDFDLTRIEKILEKILSTEDLWKRQVKELKLELLKGELENMAKNAAYDDVDEISKRSLASLVRSGNLPFKDEGKRSVEALARGGYLPAPKAPDSSEDIEVDNSQENSSLGKRGISSLAKSGQLQHGNFRFLNDEGKRGGIASLARNGYKQHKRNDDEDLADLEELLEELSDVDNDVDKRHIGSFARSFGVPRPGKRNIGSLARDGGFTPLRYAPSKKNNEEEDDEDTQSDEGQDEEKRTLASFMRAREIGKRYIGSVLRGRRFPFNYVTKKDIDSEQSNAEEDVKRYIGSLLRQGRDYNDYDETNNSEDKRHIGSFMSSKNRFEVHKKSSRSTGSDVNAYHVNDSESQLSANKATSTNTIATASKTKRSVHDESSHGLKGDSHVSETTSTADSPPRISENRNEQSVKRSKRQVYLDGSDATSVEYPMPVLQNSDLFDYGDLEDLNEGDVESPEKRFLGSVARSGWFREGPSRHSGGVTKRHIGSLARLGWLPSFHSARFNRAGRISKRTASAPREDTPMESSWAEEYQQPLGWPETSDVQDITILYPNVDSQLMKRFVLSPSVMRQRHKPNSYPISRNRKI